METELKNQSTEQNIKKREINGHNIKNTILCSNIQHTGQ